MTPVARLLPCLALLIGFLVAPAIAQDGTQVTVPVIEYAEDDRGLWERWTSFLVEFQRQANAEVAHHMSAIESGEDWGAFMLGLGVAFLYGMIHAFGPGHGKFIIMSYFLGREVKVARGILMAIQVAIVHVIAAVIIVWLADIILKAGFGISLSEVPGVRAASFLIIAAIGLYMLYQAFRAALGYVALDELGHSHSGALGHSHGLPPAPEPRPEPQGHSHAQSHGHSHGHSQAHSHAQGQAAVSAPKPVVTESRGHSHGHSHAAAAAPEASKVESGLMAFAAGVVPCPGAVLIMLYAVANDMITPGFVLVAAMSVGIGLTICLLGVGAILARQTAVRLVESSGGGAGGVALLRHSMNFGGAILVTFIGLVSFIAFLDVPLG